MSLYTPVNPGDEISASLWNNTVTLLSNVAVNLGYTPVNTALIGATSGIAQLDGSGKLAPSQIPATVPFAANSTNASVAVFAVSAGSANSASTATFASMATAAASAAVANALATARTLTLSGDVSGSVSFDGSSDVTLSSTLVNATGLVNTAFSSATFAPQAINAATGSFSTSLVVNSALPWLDDTANVATTNWVMSQGYSGIASYVGYYASGFNTSGYLSVTAPALAFGTGDFTVEFWFYPTNYSSGQYIMGDTGGSGGFRPTYGGGVSPVIKWLNDNSSVSIAATLVENTWSHLAFVRSGGTLTIYVNGVATASGSDTTNYTRTGYGIGSFANGNGPLSSSTLISNLRVGNVALYGSNFSVPTRALSSASGTVLLTLQNATFIDNGPNSYTITLNGSGPTMTATSDVYFGLPTIAVSTVNTAFASATFTPYNIIVNSVTMGSFVATTGTFSGNLSVGGVTSIKNFTATSGTFTGTVAFTGNTTAVTQVWTDNTTNVATTAFVTTAIASTPMIFQ